MASNGVEDEPPYTPDDLITILCAPSGGICMLPSNPYDEVYKNLYIGEESIAKSSIGLKKLGITHMLNCADGEDDGYHVIVKPRAMERQAIKYMAIQATDFMNFDLAQYFPQTTDYIEEGLSKGGKVMVCCKVGASRSAAVVLAFLMIKRHLPLPDAVRLVRQNREIFPNEGFLKQLSDLHEKLKRQGHYNEKGD